MTYKGTVRGGVVVLERGANLKDGTVVTIEPLKANGAAKKRRTLYDRYKRFIGTVKGPPDLARNHDYYAHGGPKRK